MEYLERKKFHKRTCRYGGILLQHHAHIILQMFEKADCVAMCLTLYTCGHGTENI